jgi:ketosteroid isomerase-like protein
LAFCLVAAGAGEAYAQTPASRDTSALFREVEALNRGMEAAMNRGDPGGAAAFYADNAIVRTPRAVVVRGRAAIDRYFEQIGKASWKLDVMQVGGHPDAPYEVGRSTLIYGARPDTSIVNFLVYWRRQPNGQLKIEMDYYQ